LLSWKSPRYGFSSNAFVGKVVGNAFWKDRKRPVPRALAGPKDFGPWWRFPAGDDLAIIKNYHISIKPYLKFCPNASVAATVRAWEQLQRMPLVFDSVVPSHFAVVLEA
jgi:hypothetical protein